MLTSESPITQIILVLGCHKKNSNLSIVSNQSYTFCNKNNSFYKISKHIRNIKPTRTWKYGHWIIPYNFPGNLFFVVIHKREK